MRFAVGGGGGDAARRRKNEAKKGNKKSDIEANVKRTGERRESDTERGRTGASTCMLFVFARFDGSRASSTCTPTTHTHTHEEGCPHNWRRRGRRRTEGKGKHCASELQRAAPVTSTSKALSSQTLSRNATKGRCLAHATAKERGGGGAHPRRPNWATLSHGGISTIVGRDLHTDTCAQADSPTFNFQSSLLAPGDRWVSEAD